MAAFGKAARRIRLHPGFRPGPWLTRHLQMALGSLGALLRTPLGSLMTISVIAIALALPSGLTVILGNLQQLVAQWEGPATISLFLDIGVSDEDAATLAKRIEREHAPAQAQLVTRREALEEFSTHSGFAAALDVLEDNPLPAVILVRPSRENSDPVATARLTAALEKTPGVEIAQLDLQWVQRLQGITEVARRGAWVISALLALAVLLIIGNTIRLEIQNRQHEIAITKLVGATDAFVRRPFLYQGFWLGLLGGITALVLVTVAVAVLEPPVTRVAALYHSGFHLLGPGPQDMIGLLGGGALIGCLGAWLSVGRHISAIEPS